MVGNGGTGGDRGLSRPPPEHVRAIYRNPYYHGLVFCSGSESGNAPIQAMVGAACPGYHGDKGRIGSRVGGGGGEVDGGGRIGGGCRRRVGQGLMKGRE